MNGADTLNDSNVRNHSNVSVVDLNVWVDEGGDRPQTPLLLTGPCRVEEELVKLDTFDALTARFRLETCQRRICDLAIRLIVSVRDSVEQ
eukprot:CAMPEP_0175975100 /NCGR_PEP_ID=MMETSP0108-20121206/43755_1 /TAXON_ID=195067 ORGANISM="Goniomonas pacifica, Strain CCMP1869" /NCGR_SAMPLE_ID=MMETSP0108 /ASSEMBLY_ACC=CAM_ASM_000204 /LENGTH=89 /DNA_ID=CAMNT_0017304807 /DNA_START=103 /DNA_END=369 /DNA_ORIENTATION=+